MAQTRGLSTREIVQAARPIAKLAEVLQEASHDPQMAEHLFMTDLLKVGLLVGNADGTLSERERFSMISITSLISFGAYVELLRWDSMEKFERDLYEENFRNLCDVARDDGLENLQVHSAVQDVDQAKQGPLLARLSDALYQFAELVARADGSIGIKEQAELDRLRARLRRPSTPSHLQSSELPTLDSSGQGAERQPVARDDSRNLAIGILVTLLSQMDEGDLRELIDHARRLLETK